MQAISPENISSTFYKWDWYIEMCGNVTIMKRKTGKRRNKNKKNGRRESSMNEGRTDRCVFDFFHRGRKEEEKWAPRPTDTSSTTTPYTSTSKEDGPPPLSPATSPHTPAAGP